jgi:3-deoxy-D-manno-octulosonate 8-phosphate phosphatase (KDO 8-P phosphatase)
MSPQKPGTEELWAKARLIQLVVLDVDGVLTDGGMYYGPQGETLKRFDVKDGHALVLARLAGLQVAWLSARTSEAVTARARDLKVSVVRQGERVKLPALNRLMEEMGVLPVGCAYMGDDVNDLEVLGRVGLSACPADAVVEVRQAADFVAQSGGGRGAVRELLELCLRASGRWDALGHHAVGAARRALD